MAVAGRGGVDPSALQREQGEEQRHTQREQAGYAAQQEQLRDLYQNPEVVRTLSDPDFGEEAQSEKAWIREMWGEHLHRDQVFSIYDEDDIWELSWLNQNIADRIMMSYPCAESRTSNERVKNVRERIYGHSKEPLTPDEKRMIRAKADQKTDREKRAKGGTFMEYILSEVINAEESSRANDDGRTLWDKVLGRG